MSQVHWPWNKSTPEAHPAETPETHSVDRRADEAAQRVRRVERRAEEVTRKLVVRRSHNHWTETVQRIVKGN